MPVVIPIDKFERYCFNGKAYFTLTYNSKSTAHRFTYRIKKHKLKKMWYVSLLTGPDNTSDYTYFAWFSEFNGEKIYKFSEGRKIGKKATSVRMFQYLITLIRKKQYDVRLQIYHEGKCLYCGAKLTDPISIRKGIGPECFKKFKKPQRSLLTLF